MATSSNQTIQALMDQVENLDANDSSIEAKLALIAQKVAEEQQKVKAGLTGQKLAPVSVATQLMHSPAKAASSQQQ